MTSRSFARRASALAVAAFAAAFATAAAGQWAWKEDNGRVVYSDRPPPANIKSSQILRQPSGAQAQAPQPAAGTATAPEGQRAPADGRPAAAAPSGPKSIAEREMEFRKRQQERAEAERKAEDAERKAAAKAADCERTRGYLRSLEDGIRISKTDASGNREFLDDAQRAAEIERARKTIQQVCN